MYLPGPKSYEVLLKDPLAADWLESYGNLKTREDYARAFMVILRGTGFTSKQLLDLDKGEARKRILAIARECLEAGHGAAALQIQTAASAFFEHHDKPLGFKKNQRIKKTRKKIGIEVIPKKSQVYAMADYIKKADSPDRIRTRAILLCLFQSGVRVGCLSKWTIGLVREQLYPNIQVPVRLKITNQMDTKLSSYGLSYYYTFLQHEGTTALRKYLDWRIQTGGGNLNDQDYIFKPSRKFAKNKRTEPDRVLQLVKTAAKNTGLDPKTVWTHALRKSFRKVLNATPELDEDTKEALMGHRLPGSRENYFDLHDLDEIAGKYMKANFDQTTDDQALAILNRRFLLMMDYSDKQIEQLNPATLSDEQMQDLLRKKGGNNQQTQNVEQDVVPMRKVKKWIKQGWEYVGQLPSGEAIVKRNVMYREAS